MGRDATAEEGTFKQGAEIVSRAEGGGLSPSKIRGGKRGTSY